MRFRMRMKRLSANILAAALTVSLLPVTALATDTDGSITWKSFESSPSYVDAVDTAQEIGSTGTEYTASIEEEGGYAYLRFTPAETAYYNVYTTGEYDVYAYLYNSNWECMAEDDDSADGINASITTLLEADTTYYIVIRHALNSITCSCGVVVEQIDDLSGEYDYGTDDDSSGSDSSGTDSSGTDNSGSDSSGSGSNTGSVSGSTGGSSGTAAKASQKITIKKAQMKKTFKAKKLKKKSQTFKLKATTSGDGKITYKKTKGNKKITISKTGKVTVKKGLKKSTYKVKVKITAAATSKCKKASVTKTITIKVN